MNESAGHPDDRAIGIAEALVEHGRWLRTVLVARGVERGAVDDVLQETTTAAIRGVHRIRHPSRLAPWLYRIAVRQALLHRRRTGRRRKLVDRYVETGRAPGEAIDDDPLAWLLAEEQQQLVRRAIAQLPRRDAEILLLKYTEDWSYRALAERLGVSPAAIEARLHRARGRLRSTLARLAPELTPQR
jgi:RNA polymerase sigma-70 factor (ECF subfamily)